VAGIESELEVEDPLGPGDATYDFIVIEDATVEIVPPTTNRDRRQGMMQAA
jgi:hypothetical protein